MSRAGAPSQRAKDAAAQSQVDAAAAVLREKAAELGAILVCDFCCRPLPERFSMYETKGTIRGYVAEEIGGGVGVAVVAHDEKWAACDLCDAVIAEGDPEALADHALASRDPRYTPEIPDELLAEVRADLVSLYRAFYSLSPTWKDDHR